MEKLLGTNMIDIYVLAMLLKGHSLAEICTHLGFCRSVATARVKKLEKTYKTTLVKHHSRPKLLTHAGCELAVKCLAILDLLAPDYTEPKSDVSLVCF